MWRFGKKLINLTRSVTRSLTFTHKFILICLIFSLFILTLFVQVVRTQDALINSLHVDLVDANFENPLLKLLESVSRHQILSQRYLLGDKALKDVLLHHEGVIQSTFDTIQANQSHMGSEGSDFIGLFDTSQIEKLTQRWTQLVGEYPQLTWRENLDRHLEIIQELRTLSNQIEISYATALFNDPAIYFLKNNLYFLIPSYERYVIELISQGEHFLGLQSQDVKSELFVGPTLPSTDPSSIISPSLIVKARKLLEKIAANDTRALEATEESEKQAETTVLARNILQELKTSSNNLFSLLEVIIKNESKVKQQLFLQESGSCMDETFQYADSLNSRLKSQLSVQRNVLINQKWQGIAYFSLYSIVTFLLGFLVLRSILNPLMNLLKAIERSSGGDLKARVADSSNEEVAKMAAIFNHMADKIETMLVNLQRTGVQLTSTTTEITAAAKEQESTMVEQEFTTKQIAQAAKEISTTAAQFSSTLQKVTKSAEQTSDLAASGQEGLTEMRSIMKGMVGSAIEIKSRLEELNQKILTITGVITTITNVADRTNLLSLNAAIEAYKLGEKGGSFGVIAGEIRRLADQTAVATLNIEKCVHDIVQSVSMSVDRMMKFSDEIHSGVDQTNGINDLFSEIISQVQRQTQSFEGVNSGMENQSQGAQQITLSLDALSETSQKSTATTKQFYSSLTQLGISIKELQNNIYNIQESPTGRT